MRYTILLSLLLLLFIPCTDVRGAQQADYDIVIYGGTAAAVTAAIQARQMDRSVVIVSPDKHLGGLSSGGLGYTDTGNKAVIGGLAREFYHRVWQHHLLLHSCPCSRQFRLVFLHCSCIRRKLRPVFP